MTTFTREELQLISKALNTYTSDYYESEETDAKALAARIYRENFRIGIPNETPDIYGTPLTPDPDRLIVCRNCGSAIADMEIHRQWHNTTAKK